MATFSYLLGKTLLSEADKERIVCAYLNCNDPSANVSLPSYQTNKPHFAEVTLLPQIDCDKAASYYGSASVGSYRKMMQNAVKKLKEAMDSGVQPEAVASPAKKGGRKRKDSAADVEDEKEESPKKKGTEADDGVKVEDEE